MGTKLLTEWLTICTSGATIDGRNVSANDLVECAKNYNPTEYTAVINYEHYSGNFGTVFALRTNLDKKNRVRLQAQLAPNLNMLEQHRYNGSKKFTSAEILPDFAGSGECYLTGLALTDSPASVGTTEIKLSAYSDKAICYSTGDSVAFEVPELGEFSENSDNSFFNFMRGMFKFSTQNDNNKPKENEMKPNDVKELSEKVDALSAVMDKMETFMANGGKVPTEDLTMEQKVELIFAKMTGEPNDGADTPPPAETPAVKLSESGAKLEQKVEKLCKSMGVELSKEVEGVEPTDRLFNNVSALLNKLESTEVFTKTPENVGDAGDELVY